MSMRFVESLLTVSRASGWSLLRSLGKLLICALIVLPFLLCVWFVDAFGVDVPVWDQWGCVQILHHLNQGTIGWTDVFFKQHGPHMIGIPTLLMATLAQFTGYDTRVEMFVGLIVLFLSCIALLQMTRERSPKGLLALVAMVPVAWLACSLRQYESLLGAVWGGIGCMLASAFFVLTVYFLDRVKSIGWSLLLAMTAGFCCTFTLGNGILVWPLGALQVALNAFLFQKLPRAKAQAVLTFWGTVSLAVGCLYFTHYKRDISTGSWPYLKDHSQTALEFVVAFLGSPLSASGDINTAITTGLLFTGVLTVLVVAVASKPERLAPSMVAPAILVAFALVSDCMIAVGRLRFGTEQATTSRYVCIGYLAIAGLYLLLLSAHKLPSRARFFLLGTVVFLMVGGSVVSVQDGLLWGRVRHDYRLGLANLLRTYRLQDGQSLKPLLPSSVMVQRLAPFVETNRLSVFREAPPHKQRTPVPTPVVHIDAIVAPARESANGLEVFTVDGAAGRNITFSGWAVDRRSRGPVGGLLICLDDKIEIPAAYGIDRPDVATLWRRGSYRRSGFSSAFLTSKIGEGSYTISFKVISPDRRSYYRTPPVAILKVSQAPARLVAEAGSRQ